MQHPERLERAASLLQQADALVIAAGAGMGVDSGLPDFRGSAGFWKAYPALGRAGIDFYRAASPDAFHERPALAWGFYGHRLGLYRRTSPHAGFELLRRWGQGMRRGCGVFTSNVDGQFQRAGFEPDLVHECHGSIHFLQCLAGCHDDIWPADDFVPDVDEARCALRNAPPRCPHCGALARPNVLMFGDGGWIDARERQQAARFRRWLESAARPVIVELGAGTDVPSVRRFSQQVQCASGARLIRINPREAAVGDPLDVALPTGALDALRSIDVLLARSPKGCGWQTP